MGSYLAEMYQSGNMYDSIDEEIYYDRLESEYIDRLTGLVNQGLLGEYVALKVEVEMLPLIDDPQARNIVKLFINKYNTTL